MNGRTSLYVLAILFATAAISADNPKSGAAKTSTIPSRPSCLNHCQASEGRCERDVRSARRDCERDAANGGRDVFTGRSNVYAPDYSQFCSYFASPEVNCGSDYYSSKCQLRLGQRHGICLKEMQNIASLRYDCYRTERDANKQCRAELAACSAACQ
jgi:hypothetical protein